MHSGKRKHTHTQIQHRYKSKTKLINYKNITMCNEVSRRDI